MQKKQLPVNKTKSTLPGRTLILLGCYLLLAVLLTWPTVQQLTTHLPGDGGDDPAIAWNLWWVKHALLNTGQNPFTTDFMFYPLGVNLAFYTLTTLNAVTALPLLLNFGIVTTSNLHMLFTFVVSGYGTFLLSRYVLVVSTKTNGSNGLIFVSSAIAGGIYAFAGSKLFYVALGQFNIASTHWIPFAVLYILKTRNDPNRLKNAVMAGLFFTLQAWAEMTYASFLLVFLGLYWLYWIVDFCIRNRHSLASNLIAASLPHVKAAAVMLLTFAIGISPILAQMLPDMLTEGDFLVEGGGFAGAFSADLLGFFIPTMLHPFFGDLVSKTGITGFDKGQHIYIGLALLGLLLVAIYTGYKKQTVRFWLIAAVVFALLSLGPIIIINGIETGIPGPFVILQKLPFFKGNRYPSRYSVMLILSLSVLSAYGLVQMGNWFKQRPKTVHRVKYAALVLVALMFLLEHLSLPLPQSDMRIPSAYQTIAADPDPATVLDIPFAWRNGFRITGALTTQFMFGQFYQTVHQKPMLQGNTSRNPTLKFQYFTQAPIINSLLALQTGKTLPPEQWETDRAIAADVLDFFNIKYIVVRPDNSGNPIVTPQNTVEYIEQLFPVETIHNEESINIYKVADTPPQACRQGTTLRVDTNCPLSPLYFGEGWGLLTAGQPITAQRENARLMLPFTGENRRLSLRLRPPTDVATENQTLAIEVNGWKSDVQPVANDWQEYSFAIPAGVLTLGVNNVWLRFGHVDTPPAAPVLDVTVLSAGEEVGGFGYIYINGQNVSPNERGYNIAVISNPESDNPTVNAASFDTHLDPGASTALIEFLANVPPNATIAVAAADEASNKLSQEAVQAIQQATGATGNLSDCFRCSHAIISTPDQTQELLNPLGPAGLTTNLGLTEPSAAAQVKWIQVE